MTAPQIQSADVRLLAGIAATLQPDYAETGISWEGSPFAWIKPRPSRQRGAIGEKLVSGFFAAKGFDVIRSPDSEADRIIENIRTEIKFSMLWENGSYKFQQLRDQNYMAVICLGISPFDAHCWAIPKSIIQEGIGQFSGLSPQHGGQQGRDTAWLKINPLDIQDWLSPYGATLQKAVKSFRRIATGADPL